MLKTKNQKIKLGIISSVVAVALLAGGTITGFILTNNDYVAVGTDSDSSSSVNSGRNKKYNSGKNDEIISDEDSFDKKKSDEDEGSEKKGSSDSSTDSNSKSSDGRDNSSTENPEMPDVISYEETFSEEDIPFSVETRNEVNLPRGEVRVASAGANGRKRITNKLTYRNGNLISSEAISSEVIAEPVNQINLIGLSDYNLNSSYIQFYPNASVSRDGGSAPAFMILVNGNYYMDFWYDPITWHRYAPAAALQVTGGSFSYDGVNYSYIIGPLDSNYALSEAFCAEYGLACGRW